MSTPATTSTSPSTTSTGTPAGPPPRTFDLSQDEGMPLGRLVSVELRKSFDTRAGRWFAIAIVALAIVATGIAAVAFPESQQDLVSMLSLTGGILGYFLPVLIILLVTSEWSQRTGLVTFTLEPRRSRVITAKVLAGLGLLAVALVLGAAIAVVGTAASVANGGTAVWEISRAPIQNFVLTSLIGVLVGFALAMLLRNSAAAIVGYFVYTFILPTVAGALSAFVDGLESIVPWVEFNTAQQPLFIGDLQPNGQEWAQLAVSGTLWLVIPFVVGVRQLIRAEVK